MLPLSTVRAREIWYWDMGSICELYKCIACALCCTNFCTTQRTGTQSHTGPHFRAWFVALLFARLLSLVLPGTRARARWIVVYWAKKIRRWDSAENRLEFDYGETRRACVCVCAAADVALFMPETCKLLTTHELIFCTGTHATRADDHENILKFWLRLP